MKVLITLLAVTLLLCTQGAAQIEYELDSTAFKYRRASDGALILKGGFKLKTELEFTIQKDTAKGSVVISANDNPDIFLYDEFNNQNVKIASTINNSGGGILLSDLVNGRENVIRLVTNYQNTGDARVVTDEIQINGGSDLAEMFDITDTQEDIYPGLLVSLDPDHPGKLMITQDAYDKKIAGIISGANGVKPGILMGQNSSIAYGEDLVTLSGRTYVMANTSNGAIKVGDRLTSSSVSGEAMKATKKKKSAGAIIGKAMTRLEKGEKGFVLVLVNMQ